MRQLPSARDTAYSVKLQIRIPIDIIRQLERIFEGNPDQIGASEIARRVGVSRKTVADLMHLQIGRPDLLSLVWSDQLSIFRATLIMEGEPEKRQTPPIRTRL